MNFKDRIHKMIKESLVTKLNSLNEGPSTPQSRLRKVMKNIKKFETPFTVVVIENNKVIDQKHSIKDWRLIPAYYREMLKKYPNATVHVEDGGGRRVQESVNEATITFKKHSEINIYPDMSSDGHFPTPYKKGDTEKVKKIKDKGRHYEVYFMDGDFAKIDKDLIIVKESVNEGKYSIRDVEDYYKFDDSSLPSDIQKLANAYKLATDNYNEISFNSGRGDKSIQSKLRSKLKKSRMIQFKLDKELEAKGWATKEDDHRVIGKTKDAISESINEGVMSELDILAKEAKDLKAFVKEAEKMLGGKADKNTIKWLALVYKTAMTESVNESSKWKSREDVIDSLVKDFKEKASSFNNTSSNQQREKFWTYNKLMQHHAKLSKKNESVNEKQGKLDFGGNELEHLLAKLRKEFGHDFYQMRKKGTKFTYKHGTGFLTLDIKNDKLRGAEFSEDRAYDFLKHMEAKGFGPNIYGTLKTLAKGKKIKGYNTILMFESVNEVMDGPINFSKGDKLDLLGYDWKVIKTDYAPKKSFKNAFTFTGNDLKQLRIPNPPKTNKTRVGYLLKDTKSGDTAFLYQYISNASKKLYTKLVVADLKESVNEGKTFKKGNKVSYKDDDGKLQVGIILKKMTNTFRGKKIVQFLIGKDGNTNTNYADRVSALSGREDEKLQSESVVTEASADGYNLHRLANNVGQNVADAFLSKHNVNFNLLAKAIQQRTINKYELRDIVNGTAPASKLKNFVKTFVKESVNEQVITEGVNDPNILKAVFLAGGPGSGKSFSAEQVFGIDSIMKGTSALGLKIVNSDPAFENELKKRGVDPKNLALMTDKVFAYYTSAKPGSARGNAKKLKTKLERIYHDGRLGLILDGTGHDFGKIAKKKKRLEQLGYDTSMLFINTSLQVAQERNKSRDRTLPEDLLEKMWQDVQNNMGKFQTLFGSKFHILDNSEMGDFSKMHNDKIKAVTKMIKAPLKNPIGKQWIEDAQKLKRLQ